MKRIILIGFAIGSFAFVSCKKNNGCARSEKAVVRDFSDSDTCGVLIELEIGTKLNPVNWEDYNVSSYKNGDLIWVSYKESSGISICGLGEVVKLKCVSSREF